MQVPLQISFRNIHPTSVIEEMIRTRATHLDRFCDHITSCRVVVEVPHRHHHTGNQYQIRIDVTVPGDEIVVTREAAEHDEAKTLTIAIREAFETVGRLLEDYVRRHRHDVKHHDPKPHARVRVVMAGQDHGFLETFDSREIYFHRNSLLDADFDKLTPGTEVTFIEEAGEKGPQATSIRVVGRHAHA